MSQGQFSRLVDEYIDAGMTLDKAISAASIMAAKHVDSFQRLRQTALDNGARLL